MSCIIACGSSCLEKGQTLLWVVFLFHVIGDGLACPVASFQDPVPFPFCSEAHRQQCHLNLEEKGPH